MGTEARHRGNRGLDAIDERILRLLEANGRATYEEIGRHVRLSANAVRGRVQSLRAKGVSSWDPRRRRLGRGAPKIEAVIDIRLRPESDGGAFEQTAIALPGAVVLEHLAGPVHYQLRVAATTIEALDEVIRRLKEELHVETNTKVVTRALRAG